MPCGCLPARFRLGRLAAHGRQRCAPRAAPALRAAAARARAERPLAILCGAPAGVRHRRLQGRRVPLPGLPLRRLRRRREAGRLGASRVRRASRTAGDVLYPTAARYANNAADLVEIRIKPTRTAVVYRVTLNTVLRRDAAAVAIGIDTDRSGGSPVPWPRGAGVSSPGIDRFIVAWGTGGQTSRAGGSASALPAGAVRIDRRRNQMTIRVPRSTMDPRRGTWRYVAGAGLWSGTGFLAVPAATAPTTEAPASGTTARSAPAILNLAFRFGEPQARGQAVWFETGQSAALASGTSGSYRADVDFGAPGLRARRTRPPARAKAGAHLPSRLKRARGRAGDVPAVRRQAPAVPAAVPPGYRRARPRRPDLRAALGRRHLHAVRRRSRRGSRSSSATSAAASTSRRSPAVPTAGTRTRPRWTSSRCGRDVARRFSLDPRGSPSAATRWAATAPTSWARSGPTCSAAPSPPSGHPVVARGCRPTRRPRGRTPTRTSCWRTRAGSRT